VLEQIEGGQIDVLVNVDLVGEGFDVPAVEAVIMARPTESLGKFLQQIGRALRFVEGKTAIIIDSVRNWERGHGMPNWPRNWTLDRRERNARAANDTIPQRMCVGCSQIYEAFHKVCPYQTQPKCDAPYAPTGRSTPAQVEGDLLELDVAAMSALFKAQEKADMDDGKYAVAQIGRNLPRIARSADMKRHQAAKYRRKVLRELTAWWVGMQPEERTLSEKHRRFYYRFGVDIGTAFTLNAKDTDALIERIKQKFTKDIAA